MAPRKPTKPKPADIEEVTEEDREPGVVYIGHVPHGFYEAELKKYFNQFGRVLKVKVSRSMKNGKSKGYAFVKFQYAAVAKTVAETCNNYLFFNKILKCEYIKLEDIHEDTFYTHRWKPNFKPKRQHNLAKTELKMYKSAKRADKKLQEKLKSLKAKGIDLQIDDIVSNYKPPQPKPKKEEKEKDEGVSESKPTQPKKRKSKEEDLKESPDSTIKSPRSKTPKRKTEKGEETKVPAVTIAQSPDSTMKSPRSKTPKKSKTLKKGEETEVLQASPSRTQIKTDLKKECPDSTIVPPHSKTQKQKTPVISEKKRRLSAVVTPPKASLDSKRLTKSESKSKSTPAKKRRN